MRVRSDVTPSPRLKSGASSFFSSLGFIGHPPARLAGSRPYGRFQRSLEALCLQPHLPVQGGVTTPPSHASR
ncbi:MAG: hypothetical protein H5T34_04635 [Candidatus Methanomethyliales bacterium]|nr:hypothetical protein [Candidatus Methanomethylicales archaeon]